MAGELGDDGREEPENVGGCEDFPPGKSWDDVEESTGNVSGCEDFVDGEVI